MFCQQARCSLTGKTSLSPCSISTISSSILRSCEELSLERFSAMCSSAAPSEASKPTETTAIFRYPRIQAVALFFGPAGLLKLSFWIPGAVQVSLTNFRMHGRRRTFCGQVCTSSLASSPSNRVLSEGSELVEREGVRELRLLASSICVSSSAVCSASSLGSSDSNRAQRIRSAPALGLGPLARHRRRHFHILGFSRISDWVPGRDFFGRPKTVL